MSSVSTNADADALKEHLMLPDTLSNLARGKPSLANISVTATPLKELSKLPVG